MPVIQTGVSVNLDATDSDASNIAEEPVHGLEQSYNLRSLLVHEN